MLARLSGKKRRRVNHKRPKADWEGFDLHYAFIKSIKSLRSDQQRLLKKAFVVLKANHALDEFRVALRADGSYKIAVASYPDLRAVYDSGLGSFLTAYFQSQDWSAEFTGRDSAEDLCLEIW